MYLNKSWLSISCCLLLVTLFPITTAADASSDTANYESKDEVIYGNLATDGDIKELYVVNSFQTANPGEIVDYGNYDSIRNLTNLSDITQKENEITFNADGESFYYQGELVNKPLPWDISITYLLDGEVVNADELAGKSGQLDIQITTSENPKVNPVFFNYYILQIAITLDPLIFNNIQAPKATEANEGKDKVLSFTVMPEEEGELILSTDVTEMEMDPISISAVPANIAMEDPDVSEMTSEMKKLADGIQDINQGVTELADGLSDWKDGAAQLKDGSSTYKNGIQELDQSSDELVEGSKQILDVMSQVNDALKQMPDIDNLDMADNVEDLPQLLRETADEIEDFSDKLDDMQDMIDQLPDDGFNDEQSEEILHILKENEVDQDIIANIKEIQDTYEEMIEESEDGLDIPEHATTDMIAMAKELRTLADDIENSIKNMDQLDDIENLQDGLLTMATEYKTFHEGLVSYTNGVHELAQSYSEVDSGIQGLVDGATTLENGATELQKGTQTLQDKTVDLPSDIQTELDKMMEEFDFSDFESASFVSDKNKNIDVVQFVLQTEKIDIVEPEKETTEKEKKSLWDRFLDLFR